MTEKNQDIRCTETRLGKIILGKDGTPRISPIVSLRNRPNHLDIKFKYGKRAGQLKPYKHKDLNEVEK